MSGRTYLIVIVLLLTMPTAVSMAYFAITKDPSLRPLGVTQEALALYGTEPDSLAIGVYVDWGEEASEQIDEATLRRFIERTMQVRTDEYFVRFNRVAGRSIHFTLVVGRNRFGPLAPNRLAFAVAPATDALEVTRRSRSLTQPSH